MASSDEETKQREEMVASMCICRSCPTYQVLGKEDDYVAYCFSSRGRSRNISQEKGCVCGVCPVYDMYGYLTMYFCTRGAEKEQKEAIAREVQTGEKALDKLRHKR